MENQNQNYQELVGKPFQRIEPIVNSPFQINEPFNYIDSQIEAEIKSQKFQQQEEMRKAMLPRYYTQGKVESQPIAKNDDSPSFLFRVGYTVKEIVLSLLILIMLAALLYINYYYFWR